MKKREFVKLLRELGFDGGDGISEVVDAVESNEDFDDSDFVALLRTLITELKENVPPSQIPLLDALDFGVRYFAVGSGLVKRMGDLS